MPARYSANAFIEHIRHVELNPRGMTSELLVTCSRSEQAYGPIFGRAALRYSMNWLFNRRSALCAFPQRGPS